MKIFDFSPTSASLLRGGCKRHRDQHISIQVPCIFNQQTQIRGQSGVSTINLTGSLLGEGEGEFYLVSIYLFTA